MYNRLIAVLLEKKYVLVQYLSKLLEISKTACVFKWENAFFQSAIISVIK